MIARDRNADNNATTGTGGLEERVYGQGQKDRHNP
jgi:hypothetical protein